MKTKHVITILMVIISGWGIVFLQFFCISSVGTVEVGKVVGTG